jgi:hypothetical protein
MKEIHYGDTEHTEVARNDRLRWTRYKFIVEKQLQAGILMVLTLPRSHLSDQTSGVFCVDPAVRATSGCSVSPVNFCCLSPAAPRRPQRRSYTGRGGTDVTMVTLPACRWEARGVFSTSSEASGLRFDSQATRSPYQ